MPNPLVLVRVEQLVNQVLALGRHLLVLRVWPGDATVKDVLKDLLRSVGAEGGVACPREGEKEESSIALLE